MLENLIVVRQYIRRDIDITFEILPSLVRNNTYPRRFCSNGKRFNYGRIGNLVDTGHVRLMTIEGKRNLYCLSATGKGIAEFYECLVGETKIPEYKELNPMAKPKATAFDKKRMEMIKKLIRLFPITRNRF
jgi:hypothetical protein